MRRALWVVLGAALGCELTHPYPEVFEETGAARCADGVDQDLDGKVDCADEDCAGACAERGQGWCADGLDQDADGRVDLEDPDCWPDAAAEVERCVSTRSTLGALSVDDRAAWVGTGRIAEHADPDGARYAVMLGQRGQHLLSAHVSAGALEGAELALEAWLQPLAVLEVALLPASAAETGPDFPEDHPDALFVTVGLTETWGVEPPWMLVRRGQELPAIAAGLPASRLPARTWTRLSLRIAAGQLEVRLGEASEPSRFQQAGNEVTLRPPASWSESQPLRFAWRAPLEAEVRIRAAEWQRAPHHPCGYAVPQLAGPVLAAAAMPSGRLCVLERAAAELRTRALLFEDPASFTEVGELVTPARDPVAAALEWREEGLRGGLLLAGSDGVTWTLELLRSPDCARWTLEPSGLDPELLAFAQGGGLTLERDASGVVLHVSVGAGGLLRAHSPDGAPGSFRFVPGSGHRLPVPDPRLAPALAHLTAWSGHWIATVPDDEGLRAWVHAGDGAWRSGAPLVRPSGRAGTFDARAIREGRLALFEGARGWLLYRGDASDATAVARVQWLGP